GLSDLRAWNNLSGNNIHPGQKLKINKTVKTKAGSETVDEKPNPVDKNTTAANNGTKSDDKSAVDITYHTVQAGDTLWDIAKKYPGISVNDIKAANSNLNSSH